MSHHPSAVAKLEELPVNDHQPAEDTRACHMTLPHDTHRWDTEDREPLRYTCPGHVKTNADEACGDYPAPCNCDDPTTHDGALRERNFVMTHADRTLERVARAIDPESWRIRDTGPFPPEHQAAQVVVRDSMEAAERVLNADVLTTACTGTTREELAEHLRKRAKDDEDHADRLDTEDPPTDDEWDAFWDDHLTVSHMIDRRALRIEGRPETIADAVLTLWGGQPDPADVWGRAVKWARAHAAELITNQASQDGSSPTSEYDYTPYRTGGA